MYVYISFMLAILLRGAFIAYMQCLNSLEKTEKLNRRYRKWTTLEKRDLSCENAN